MRLKSIWRREYAGVVLRVLEKSRVRPWGLETGIIDERASDATKVEGKSPARGEEVETGAGASWLSPARLGGVRRGCWFTTSVDDFTSYIGSPQVFVQIVRKKTPSCVQ